MYESTTHSSCAYDVGDWHSNCTGVTVVAAVGHSHGILYCPSCRVVADVEACAAKIKIESSWYARAPIGTKGAAKKETGG